MFVCDTIFVVAVFSVFSGFIKIVVSQHEGDLCLARWVSCRLAVHKWIGPRSLCPCDLVHQWATALEFAQFAQFAHEFDELASIGPLPFENGTARSASSTHTCSSCVAAIPIFIISHSTFAICTCAFTLSARWFESTETRRDRTLCGVSVGIKIKLPSQLLDVGEASHYSCVATPLRGKTEKLCVRANALLIAFQRLWLLCAAVERHTAYMSHLSRRLKSRFMCAKPKCQLKYSNSVAKQPSTTISYCANRDEMWQAMSRHQNPMRDKRRDSSRVRERERGKNRIFERTRKEVCVCVQDQKPLINLGSVQWAVRRDRTSASVIYLNITFSRYTRRWPRLRMSTHTSTWNAI